MEAKVQTDLWVLVAPLLRSTGASVLGGEHGPEPLLVFACSSCVLALLPELWWPYLAPFGGALLFFSLVI